ncbi:MAG: M10 family metallopeptidase C-terminal domain-containing protein [Roseomonas sp.]|nr:M10 family metallopeptidase C-terminal domain-containing protein [Roseomonas sp.]MCA3326280.1 M10 family metallopeptidase C-terminal domain-containing protein [Roseomonas sp.]MCA3329429.1 M10 family metallopeptidase C-terminal domain-containing protein [Roseomonas sp.]MCA3335822.1 M10 family metallopeptidase C-terminal domain-containing protein [Roseomonas sp.]MCA3345933.1 M10 family metallopeptidase C-terminal domain-containing protein [Roseomonas sp.]
MSGTAYEVTVDGTPTNGANPWIDSLVMGGAWQDSSGLITTGGPVTISYNLQFGLYDLSYARPWTSSETSALLNALEAWEAVANIDFVSAPSSQADVWMWSLSNWQIGGDLGYSETPGFSFVEPLYMGFNNQHFTWVGSGVNRGGQGFVTLIHELGHLLGLAHPHDGGLAADATVFPGVTAEFDDYGDYGLNQGIFTVMGYNDGWITQYPNHSDVSYGWTATPMALDIAAIQIIYGANTSYASGNNTYTLPTVNAAGTFWSCIWDTGGVDVISNSGSSVASIINLNAAPLTGPNAGGYVSYASNIIGGFTIANNVVIENAMGGSANDTLIGNAANNLLTGNAGADNITGDSGNDTLDGGLGADSLFGGEGDDRFLVDTASDQVIESVGGGADTVIASVSYVMPANIEALILGDGVLGQSLTGGSAGDLLVGNGNGNNLSGGAGNDTLDGGAGIDTLIGGEGADRFLIDNASDQVIESIGGGADIIITSVSYTMPANVEALMLAAGFSGLSLTGSNASDTLIGNGLANNLFGGAGDDIILAQEMSIDSILALFII